MKTYSKELEFISPCSMYVFTFYSTSYNIVMVCSSGARYSYKYDDLYAFYDDLDKIKKSYSLVEK